MAEEKKKGRIRRGLAWTFKPMVNVKGWLGVDSIKESTRQLSGLAREAFTTEEAQREETYEEALKRLKLTDKQIQQKLKDFYRLFLTYGSIAFVCLLYAIYLAFAGTFGSFLVGIVVCCIALVQAFRFHFWIFQIKHKKLGCTVSEWYHSKITGDKNAK